MATTPITAAFLKETAKSVYIALCNKPRPESLVDLPLFQKHLSPEFKLYHDSKLLPDGGGRDAFLVLWSKMASSMPDLHMEIRDAVAEVEDAEEGNGRVWLYSKITGLHGGVEKLSVDMMKFEKGVLVEVVDIQRTL
jgi:hypothetical protein